MAFEEFSREGMTAIRPGQFRVSRAGDVTLCRADMERIGAQAVNNGKTDLTVLVDRATFRIGLRLHREDDTTPPTRLRWMCAVRGPTRGTVHLTAPMKSLGVKPAEIAGVHELGYVNDPPILTLNLGTASRASGSRGPGRQAARTRQANREGRA